MQGSQFTMQPNFYINGQEYATPSIIKDSILEPLPNFSKPPSVPMDNKQSYNFQPMALPQQPYQIMPNQSLRQDFAYNQRMIVPLNYPPLQMVGQVNPNIGGQPQGYMPGLFPLQAQNNYANNKPYGQRNDYDGQGKRGFEGNKGRYASNGRYKEQDKGERNERSFRSDRDDKNDRRDRGERNNRGGRGRGERKRGGDRNIRGDKGGRGEKYERGERIGFSKHKNFDNEKEKRDKRNGHHSRSQSSERRNTDYKKGRYNKERGVEERYKGKGNFKPFDRNQRGNHYRNSKPENYGSDWKCIDCGNVNWARRDACNRCHVKRPENAPLIPKDLDPKDHNNHSTGNYEQNPHGLNNLMNNLNRNNQKEENFKDNSTNNTQPQVEGGSQI